MAVSHGKAGVFTLDSVDLPGITSVTPSFDLPTSDATAMGDTARTNLAGIPGGTISIAGWLDPTASTGNDENLFDNLIAGTAVAWVWGPNGDATGALKYSGNALVSAYSPSGEIASTVAFTATLTITGAITSGTYA